MAPCTYTKIRPRWVGESAALFSDRRTQGNRHDPPRARKLAAEAAAQLGLRRADGLPAQAQRRRGVPLGQALDVEGLVDAAALLVERGEVVIHQRDGLGVRPGARVGAVRLRLQR